MVTLSIHTCIHTYMQTLDGAGCSDNSRALGNIHYLRLYFSHFPPLGQMLQYVSSFCDVPHWPGTQGGGRGEGGGDECQPGLPDTL